MSHPQPGPSLLALDPGVRESGWAIFQRGQLRTTGLVSLAGRRRVSAADRVEHLTRCLDEVAAVWTPRELVYCKPSGIRWPVPSLELLEQELAGWADRCRIQWRAYTAQEVRAAIAGHSRVSRDQLAYAIMVPLRLIGQRKSTHEWEAIAVGYYHLMLSSRGTNGLREEKPD